MAKKKPAAQNRKKIASKNKPRKKQPKKADANKEPRRKRVASPLQDKTIQRVLRKLDLQTVEPWAQQDAIEAFAKGDPQGFTDAAYSTGGTLAIVVDNGRLLMNAGIYEAALVHGYTGCKWSHRLWDMDVIQSLFDWGDREKLRAVGSSLPGPGPFTLYRGVSREGKERQVDGMSWISSLDVACFFALVLKHDPAVYQATVPADDVYCYFLERGEDEFICRPKESQRLPLSLEEIEKGAARWNEAKKVHEQQMLKQVASKTES